MARPGPVPRPVADRLWARVTKTPDCWVWTGGVNEFGYGNILQGGPIRRMVRTHRMAWELAYGPIPDGLYVCHKCDNPPCCRPSHLFLGTQADNLGDAKRKGRMASGARAGAVAHPECYPWKMGRAKAQEARMRAAGRRGAAYALAKEYGISYQSMRKILIGETYK